MPVYGKRLRLLSLLSIVFVGAGLALAFFSAPLDADQGFRQKIFYIHVPLAIVAMAGFIAGGVAAVQYLRTMQSRWDLRSYTWIHLALIFALAALVTGSIWAKTAWGHWWVWDEPTLVSFLIVFLLYCTYQPLRFSLEDRDKQSRYAAVFAITAGAFVPLNFLAVRMAQSLAHPRVLATSEGGLPGSMQLPFYTMIVGVGLLFVTLTQYEMANKHVRANLREIRARLSGDDEELPIRRSASPSLPTTNFERSR
jgi:heme exporter protein C